MALTMKTGMAKSAAVKRSSVAPKRATVTVRASAIPADVPDMNRRNTMNLVLASGIGGVVVSLAGPYALFFVPPSSGGGSGGQAAKDALGNDVKASAWLKTHPKGSYELTQGLKGDPTYLVVTQEGDIEKFGLNAVCTHLGCVVPWVAAENKFKCPCHGSQYNSQGKVIRGPAPLSLALAHVSVSESDTVTFTPWTETDFRTGLEPWWK